MSEYYCAPCVQYPWTGSQGNYVISPVQVIFHSQGDPVDNVSRSLGQAEVMINEASVSLTDVRG
jgi:hypothetical protein